MIYLRLLYLWIPVLLLAAIILDSFPFGKTSVALNYFQAGTAWAFLIGTPLLFLVVRLSRHRSKINFLDYSCLALWFTAFAMSLLMVCSYCRII